MIVVSRSMVCPDDGIVDTHHAIASRDDLTSVFIMSIQLASVPTPSSSEPELIHAVEAICDDGSGS